MCVERYGKSRPQCAMPEFSLRDTAACALLLCWYIRIQLICEDGAPLKSWRSMACRCSRRKPTFPVLVPVPLAALSLRHSASLPIIRRVIGYTGVSGPVPQG